jgi:MFS family permease
VSKIDENEKVLEKNQNDGRVWNLNFFLLWQGQVVSGVGDFFYQIALGFWILAVTGSTALMATVMAASLVPQIIISPFAGVAVDRVNRKWLIVIMDVIRGIAVLLISIASFAGMLKIWMVLAVGVVLGICLSFFNPSVQSSIPDIVPDSKLIKANAAFSMIRASSKIIGDSVGGFLFQVLGVPLIFLINGISYLFSAFTEIFVKLPTFHNEHVKKPFFEDMKEGFLFTWRFKGIRYLFLHALISNFLRVISIILVLPLFQMNEALGAGLYGLTVGIAAGGAFAGFLLSSIIHFKPSGRFFMMCLLGSIFSICRGIFPFFLHMYIILPLMFISGFTVSISINLFEASIPLTCPPQKRGKVLSLLNIVTSGVWPFGMIAAGILAEFISIPILIAAASSLSLMSFITLYFIPSSKHVVNFDSEKQKREDIM